MRAPIVSLIGRPNVGKSTIYNRLLKRGNKILTHDLPGVTRDRHYSILSTGDVGEFDSQDLILIDTGGFYPEEVEENQRLKKKENYEPFFNIMREQAQLAISESDLILFVVDVREGMLPFDQQIIDYLRRSKKTFWVLVNKFDSENQYGDEVEFYSLGIDEFLLTSAEHNRGMDEIRERLCKFSHEMKQKLIDEPSLDNGMSPEHEVVADVAIIGAPNVGKSTLLNRLIGEKRALVSDIAGTTVDPIEGYFNLNFGQRASELKAQKNEFYKHNKDILEAYREHQEQLFTAQEQVEQLFDEAEDDELDEQEVFTDGWRSIKIVDTAGIRKNKLVSGHIESQSVYRSLRSITESEIVIFLVDATKGITHQDRRLMDIALDKGKSLIICLNKIDLVNEIMQDREQKQEWIEDLRYQIPWLQFCELTPLSALKGSHLKSLLKTLRETILIRRQKMSTGRLNKALTDLVNRTPVTVENARGAKLKVKYASQVKSNPPTVLIFVNKSKGIPDHYRRYLTNGLRREFGLINTPLHLVFRTTSDIKRKMKPSERRDYQALT